MHRVIHLHHICHYAKFKLSGLSSLRKTGGGGGAKAPFSTTNIGRSIII